MYDYIIVGAGAAGCAIAARLSENLDVKILLLDAGGKDNHPFIHMPVGFAKMTDSRLTWGYHTVPKPATNNRKIPYAQAKVIGGGSSINAQVFTRGCPEDYDRWAKEENCEGWSFEDVQPYFIKSEGNEVFSGKYHGEEGPLGIANLLSPHTLTQAFVKACQEYGMAYNPDFNGAQQAGCSAYQVNQRHRKRCSAAAAYIHPIKNQRKNLTILYNAMSLRILMENNRAIGIEYEQNGKVKKAHAAQEVIVAAGAIGSPKLLMLSGIGRADELKKLGITPQLELMGVGQNLQDHYDVDIIYELSHSNSLDRYKKIHHAAWAGLQYFMFKTGPVTSTVAEGGAFWTYNAKAPTPDLQFHFLPGSGVEAGIPPVPSGYGCTLNFYHVRPHSRGSVTLQSNNPQDHPLIDPNYIGEAYDLEVTLEALKISRDIMAQSAFKRHIKGEHYPGYKMQSDKELIDYIRQYGRTAYHPVGTCKMGIDEMAVVTPDLKVRGLEGLRIADSSIMPSLISSNTNAPSVMIGEKASDIIKANM